MMAENKGFLGSILMLSTHGYVGAESELGKPDTGGQVVFVLELAKRFSRLGYKVDIVTRRFEQQPEFDQINEGLRVWRIAFGGEKFIRKEDMHEHLSDFVTNFLAAIKKREISYDVVNSHYWDAGWAGQKIAEELRIPHIHTPHSLGFWKQRDMEKASDDVQSQYRLPDRIHKEFLIYRSCDHIIATTEEQQELMMEEYSLPEKHISVIPPGVDENRFTPAPQRIKDELQAGYGLNPYTIFTVGRMAANKGYDLLIRSLPVVLKMCPDARLLLATGGEKSASDREKEEELIECAHEVQVHDKIIWENYIPDEELANYYRAAAVFALPSRYEPFGMTAIEAMACGTPTIVTIYGGLHDLIDFGTQALFADPNQPEEFGTMLALPMRYPRLAEELSNEGSRFARRTFGWTGIAKHTLAVFDQYKAKYLEPFEAL
jgi:mannosylfructose-phosphate synthase